MQIKSLPGMRNRINVAAWYDDVSHTTQLLARHVNGVGGVTTPDWGRLELLSFDANRQLVSERVVWEGKCKALNLEDPRARVSFDGRVLLGLTAVIEEGNAFVPYPAFCTLSTVDWQGGLEGLVVATSLDSGKNLTPLTDTTWVYRKESDDFSLTLLTRDRETATATGSLTLDPVPSWASHKIGTTMPPIWITENEALFFLHGVSKIGDMYHYALGRAKLVRNGTSFRISHVDPRPFLIPDDLAETAKTLGIGERHQFRRVVYCCGGIIPPSGIVRGFGKQNQELSLFVNIGDSQTVEVMYPLAELTKGWW